VPDQIEQDEPAAISSDVSDQTDQIFFTQVVAQICAKCHIGPGQRVESAICPNDWQRPRDCRARLNVHTYTLYGKVARNPLQNQTSSAPHVQHAADGKWIPADRPD
jgi:hypothetical protein